MNRTSHATRALVSFICMQMALSPALVAAQERPVATTAPADARTSVTNSANGTPVVNIAEPNAAGVSHNRYTSYDVDERGLILNNSSTNALSLLGGGTAANPNLASGRSAELILNEVVTANPGSMLRGYQEILGGRAELVIANPWGITCDGCGFLNTPRVTLTTGTPTLAPNGSLSGFTITGGRIAVAGEGLDATRQSTLDLLARSVSIEGNVIAGGSADVSGDLQVSAGTHTFDYVTRTASALSSGGSGPQFAIDSSALGGMYADRIHLLVTEQGAGVRTAGNLAAVAEDLSIQASGRVELRGAASAARDLAVSGTDVQVQLESNDTYMYAGRDLGLSSAGALELGTGWIGAQRDASLTSAGSVAVRGAQFYAGANGTVDARHLETDADAIIAANGALAVRLQRGDAAGIDNAGLIQAHSVSIDEVGVPSPAGSVVLNRGVIAGDDVTIAATQVSNQNGAIQADSRLDVRSATLQNAGADALIVGSTKADGTTFISAGDVFNTGTIWSQGDLTLDVLSLDQQRDVGASANPLIGAGRDLTLAFADRGRLGTGDLQAGRDLTIAATSLSDRGNPGADDVRSAGRNFTVIAAPGGQIDLGERQWAAAGDVRLTADSIDNAGTIAGRTVALAGTGTTALTFTNRSNAQLIGDERVTIGTPGQRAGSIVVEAAQLGTSAGVYGGVLAIDTVALDNFGTILGSGAGSLINVDRLTNAASGSILGFADVDGNSGLEITGHTVRNQGFLYDSSFLRLDANDIFNDASGTIGSAGLLQVSTQGDGSGATPLDNIGEIWGRSIEMTLWNGLINGRDPGVTANRGLPASIYADQSLFAGMFLGSNLQNYGSIESAGNMILQGAGGGDLRNEMSMVSETRWNRGDSPRQESGDLSLTSDSGKKHSVSIDGIDYYYFGDTTSTAYFDRRATYLETEQLDIDPASIAQPSIRAQGNLSINGFQNVVNTGASLGADGNVTIASTLAGSSITNSSLVLHAQDRIEETSLAYECQIEVLGAKSSTFCGGGPNEATLHRDQAPTQTRYSDLRAGRNVFAGRIYAGGVLTPNVQVVVNEGVPGVLPLERPSDPFAVDSNSGPGELGVGVTPGGRALVLNGAQIPLPASRNGRFVSSQDAGNDPLIETNPLFGIDSAALGSEYLAKLLGLDPETQTRRLGDDNYESYLIQQQIKAATGRGLLGNYYSGDEMLEAMFDNAAAESERLDLGYGKALTSAQVASLQSDIVWMVEQEVEGHKVLVPVVYLSNATRASVSSDPSISGYNVVITAGSVRNTGGQITASNYLGIQTSGDIENLSGRMSGWNVNLDAGGDIVNSTLVKRYGDAENGHDSAQRTATIEAGQTAILNAGRDINVRGATVAAGKDAALIAGRNVNVAALALTSNYRSGDGGDSATTQSQTAVGAGIQAGRHVQIKAGEDVTIKGADIAAGGVAQIRAERGNVDIGVLELTNSSTSTETRTGRYDQFDRDREQGTIGVGQGIEKKTTTESSTRTVGVGSRIAGNGVDISTGKGDVNITGSDIDAGKDGAFIDSARDVNIAAYNNKSQTSSTVDATRGGVRIDASTDGVFAGTAQSGDKTTTTTTQTTARTSTLTSAGDIVVRAKGTITNEGTKYAAGNNIVLDGDNVVNKAAQDTYTTTTSRTEWETKQQSGFTTNGTAKSIADASQGRGNQVTVNNIEAQTRVTGSGSTETSTSSETRARTTEIEAGGNVVVKARNNASDEGTQYSAGKNIVISAENYESKAAADTSSNSSDRTSASGQFTAGLNTAAEVAVTASAEGGHEKSSQTQSTARTGSMRAGGAVVIEARSGDVTLEGTQIDGAKGVGISAARDIDIKQANDTVTTSSSSQTGSGRVSASVSVIGTGGSVGAGASTRTAKSDTTESTARTANIRSGNGDVQLDAGRDLKSQGTDIEAAGNAGLKAGRNIDLAAAVDTTTRTGRVDGGGADVTVGFGTGSAKGNGSVNASVDFERSRTDYSESKERGSTIKAGGNFTVDAGNNARLEGTKVDAETATLRTGGNLVLESAQHTVKDDSYSVSGRLEASASKGGGTGGANSVGQGSSGSGKSRGANAGGGNAQVDVTRSDQDIETNSNATINTRGGTTVKVGGDMTLAGANINAQGGVSGQVAGNLNIETRVDKTDIDVSDVKTYAGVAPVGGTGGGSKFDRTQDRGQAAANQLGQTGGFADVKTQKKDNLSVGTASGISGGGGGIDLKVGGDTTLTGASNAGTDFKTQGRTTVASVETRTRESGTELRIAGTIASAAGSDKGKGGDMSMSLNLPSDGPAPARRPVNTDDLPKQPAPRAPRTEAPVEPSIQRAPRTEPPVEPDTRRAPRTATVEPDVPTLTDHPTLQTTIDLSAPEMHRRVASIDRVEPAVPIPSNEILRTYSEDVQRVAAVDPRVRTIVDAGSKLKGGDLDALQLNLSAIVKFDGPQAPATRERLLAQLEESARGPRQREQDGLTEFPMFSKYVGENVPGLPSWLSDHKGAPPKRVVKYYSPEQRAAHRLYIQNGALTFADGPLETGKYIFVVDRSGHLIAGHANEGEIHHSSLSGGEPVLMAGEFTVDSFDGYLSSISNQSGHFRPTAEALRQLIGALRTSGLNLGRLEVSEFSATSEPGTGTPVVKRVNEYRMGGPGMPKPPSTPMLRGLDDPLPAQRQRRDSLGIPGDKSNYMITDPVPEPQPNHDGNTASLRDIFNACLRSMLLSCSPLGSPAIAMPLTG